MKVKKQPKDKVLWISITNYERGIYKNSANLKFCSHLIIETDMKIYGVKLSETKSPMIGDHDTYYKGDSSHMNALKMFMENKVRLTLNE